VSDIADYGSSGLNQANVRSADLCRPVRLAELSPGRYNLIDGHHRAGNARRDGTPTLPARRSPCPSHVPFLASTTGLSAQRVFTALIASQSIFRYANPS
jgi:hypothetical protein